ncbi:MAG: hypothetical protein KDA59_09345, partial [Planctomycetales bacterium]|nr:hypothetical protein [Planctomycetales bacterium]
ATGNLTIDMQLTADTPADDLPVIGKYIAGALSWDAAATYDLATGAGAYEIDEDTLPSFANFERQIRDDFLTMVDQYNPLPQEFRDFLTMDIDFFAGQSIADMIGLGDAEILLNPLKFKGQQDVDVNQQDGGEHIELLYTFTEPQNIIAMLTGKTVDFFRLDIDKTFADAQIEFPVVPETPVATFFGIVNVTLEVNVQVGFAFALDVMMGLDSNGFYVLDDTDPALSVTGRVTAVPIVEGDFLTLDFARVTGTVGLAAVGEVDLVMPDAIDGKIRAGDIYHKGKVNTDVLAFTRGFDLEWSLKGELGFLGVDALTAETSTYSDSYRLYELNSNGSQPGGSQFDELKDDMNRRAQQLLVCGLATTGNPIAIAGCAILSLPDLEAMAERAAEWLGDRWDDTVDAAKEFANQAAAEAKKVAEKVEKFFENLANGVTEAIVQLGELGDQLLSEIGNLFGGGNAEWEVVTPPNRGPTFTTRVDQNVLYVSWLESHLPGKDWRSDAGSWTQPLPAGYRGTTEPFEDDGDLPVVRVFADGYLEYDGRRYHVLDDDLTTAGHADDIYIEPSDNRVAVSFDRRFRMPITGEELIVNTEAYVPAYYTIRWDATNKADGSDVQVAARIYYDGQVQFDYGPGNTGLSPKIGTTIGGQFIPVPGYDGVADLADARSVRIAIDGTPTILGSSQFTIDPAYDLVDQADDRAASLSVSLENNTYIIDGADFLNEEVVAEKIQKSGCLDGCEKDVVDERREMVRYPNR